MVQNRNPSSAPRQRDVGPQPSHGRDRWHLSATLIIGGSLLLIPPDRATAGQQATGIVPWTQTQADDFTRYELLDPENQSFRIVYDVSATSPGARLFFNAIRPGSEPTVHGVTDLSTGSPLQWKLVTGEEAAGDGWVGAREGMRYIRVELPRPVPSLEIGEKSISPVAGEVRLRIDKTYRDPESYSRSKEADEETITFARSLGIRRNEVLLPAGWTVTSVNTPVQVDTESDGRVRLSFQSAWPATTDFEVSARRFVEPAAEPATSGTATPPPGIGVGAPAEPAVPGQVQPAPGASRRDPPSRVGHSFTARARQDREILYELLDPTSHSFRLWHDYTEQRVGMDRYLNVVRPGSRATDPEAWDVDSGERLKVETLRGAEITQRELDIGGPVRDDSEVVLISYRPVPEGGSRRLRIEETYTDPSRYGLEPPPANSANSPPVLIWDRSFGRPRNAVVLPPGWRLLTSSIPGRIGTLDDGRLRLDFDNDRNDSIRVLLRAQLEEDHGDPPEN